MSNEEQPFGTAAALGGEQQSAIHYEKLRQSAHYPRSLLGQMESLHRSPLHGLFREEGFVGSIRGLYEYYLDKAERARREYLDQSSFHYSPLGEARKWHGRSYTLRERGTNFAADWFSILHPPGSQPVWAALERGPEIRIVADDCTPPYTQTQLMWETPEAGVAFVPMPSMNPSLTSKPPASADVPLVPLPVGESLTSEQRTQAEDSVREMVENSSPFVQATMYKYLNAAGMSLSKADDIRRKARKE